MFRRFGFFVVAALCAASPVAAQDERPVQLTIGGGYTSVLGPASDHGVGSGGNFTIGALFKVSPVVSLQGEYGWNGMKRKQIDLPSVNPLEANKPFFADANMQYGDANVLFHPATQGKAQPYGLVGLGVYYRPVSISTDSVGFASVCDPYWYVCYPAAVRVEQIVGSRSSTDFGMNFGGGVNFKLTDHTSFYAEIRYHYIWGPELATVNPLSSSSSTPTKANGKFLPITFGFRF
jgi:opacity protein-like surface antigen